MKDCFKKRKLKPGILHQDTYPGSLKDPAKVLIRAEKALKRRKGESAHLIDRTRRPRYKRTKFQSPYRGMKWRINTFHDKDGNKRAKGVVTMPNGSVEYFMLELGYHQSLEAQLHAKLAREVYNAS